MAAEVSRDRLPEGPLLLLAPHFDDAALSCSAILDRPGPVDVLTVFAGAPEPASIGDWDAMCGFADSNESVAVRRSEEEAALGVTAHRLSFLPLLEAQYAEGRSGAESAAIVEAVGTWAAANEDGLIAVPAGAGWAVPKGLRRLARRLGLERIPPRHPDHLLVRDAVLDAWRAGSGWTPMLYEEFPYLHGGRADARSLPGSSVLLDVPVDRERKARRIAAYASQVPYISPPGLRVDDPAALPELERYWLLTG